MSREEKCIYCGEVIPEGRIVCAQCENAILRMGAILQSNEATEEEVDEAYDFIQTDNSEHTQGENEMFNRKRNEKNNYSKVTVNGKTVRVSGNNIIVSNGKVIVDGKVIEENLAGDITVIVEGNCNKVDAAGSVEVHGDCGSVDCSGSCTIRGNVTGNVDASGSVTCGNIGGDIDCSGSIHCRR